VDLVQALYALDSTTIDLCLSVFPWARFRKHKGAVKMHTLLTCAATSHVHSHTDGKVHDVNILDELLIEAGAFYVMDRANRFERLSRVHALDGLLRCAHKENILLQRRYSHPVDKSTGVRSDQTVVLAAIGSLGLSRYAAPREHFDNVTAKRLVFLTNNSHCLH